jgi:transposase InsO family protein
MDKTLNNIYTNVSNPASFSSIAALYKEAKRQRCPGVTIAKVKEFLKSQDTYTLHKQAVRRFKRNRIIVSSMDEQWQIDLADMRFINKENNGFKWLLTCIDVLSKFAWTVAVRSKNGNDVTTAFASILRAAHPRKPERIQSDKGGEFVNHHFKQLMKEKSIAFFVSQNEETKCAIVERFNRYNKK